jgi:predicted alpha/beta-hydrolase family hydrolase
MTVNPEPLKITVNERDSVSALLYAAPQKERAAMTIILGHGAGAGQLHPFMRLFASGLAARGFDTITFNFIYMEQGRHVPDPKAKLEACYSAVIEAARGHKKLKGNRVVVGGKSMGGRIASQVAALECGDSSPLSKALTVQRTPKNNISGLVLLGYPLHPPGHPEKLRDAHLSQIKAPMLIVQGARDAFGTSDELRAVIKKHRLPATLHIIEGGDHSFKVPKSVGVPQTQVYENVMDEIARWLLET